MRCFFRNDERLQSEIEGDAGERFRYTEGFITGREHCLFQAHDQAVPSGKGKVIVDIGITRNIDLCCQCPSSRFRHQKVDVRWPVAVSPQQVEKFRRGAGRGMA